MGALGISSFVDWVSLVDSLSAQGSIQDFIGPWKPPQFGPQLYSLTVTQSTTTRVGTAFTPVGIIGIGSQNTGGFNTPQNSVSTTQQTAQITTYFFDAVLRAEHRQELRRTEHPIQSGASIVDHCYLLPARVTLEIGMSDVMASFVAGQYSSDPSKSVSAYQTLLNIQKLRVPITLSTRLNQYSNMVIEHIAAIENHQSRFALRATVSFAQIITAQIATQTTPARPDQTTATNAGTKQPTTPPPSVSGSAALSGFANP